jgi:hypothetical protein
LGNVARLAGLQTFEHGLNIMTWLRVAFNMLIIPST